MRDFSQLIRERRGDDKHETRRKFSALKLGAIYVLLRINTAGQWKSVRKILRKHWSSGKKGEGSTNEIKCRQTGEEREGRSLVRTWTIQCTVYVFSDLIYS